MSLYEDLIALVNKYFYKTDEKPAKYNEWLTSEYINGKWYIGYVRQFKMQNEHLFIDEEYKNIYKLENGHLYVDTDDITQYKIENEHLYKRR